ncbi:MAG: hypothetical protein V4525_03270 [Pseudomonadota bacterium]
MDYLSSLPLLLECQQTDTNLFFKIKLEKSLFCFDGHFPGFPVLPGVVQIHWAFLFAEKYWGARGRFLALEQIKFIDIVQPEDNTVLNLLLEWNADKQRVAFEYSIQEKRVSSGRICFSNH